MSAAIFTRQRLTDGVYGLVTDGGRQMWSRCKLRKPKNCEACSAALAVGDPAYRPLTSATNRMWRICCTCVEKEESMGRAW